MHKQTKSPLQSKIRSHGNLLITFVKSIETPTFALQNDQKQERLVIVAQSQLQAEARTFFVCWNLVSSLHLSASYASQSFKN